MKKELTITILLNPNTGNLIISREDNNSQRSVVLPESLHPALYEFLIKEAKLKS